MSQSESGVMDMVRNGAIVAAILLCVGLIGAQFVGGGADDAEEIDAAERDATVERIQPVAVVNIAGQAAETAASEPADTSTPTAQAESVAAAPQAIDGAALYQQSCLACHGNGVAGAPVVGDTAAWGPRIASGQDALVSNAINGKGAMPAKGGAVNLSDEQVTAVVVYMIQNSQ